MKVRTFEINYFTSADIKETGKRKKGTSVTEAINTNPLTLTKRIETFNNITDAKSRKLELEKEKDMNMIRIIRVK